MRVRLIVAIVAASWATLSMNVSAGVAQVLTINTGSTLTIGAGSIVDVNCRDILVKSGGTLLLEAAQIRDKAGLVVEAGGVFTNTFGTILFCGQKSFYLVFPPAGNPIILTFPKTEESH
jgi:hypothetical protein